MMIEKVEMMTKALSIVGPNVSICLGGMGKWVLCHFLGNCHRLYSPNVVPTRMSTYQVPGTYQQVTDVVVWCSKRACI